MLCEQNWPGRSIRRGTRTRLRPPGRPRRTDEERKVEQDDITQQFERVAEILSESTSINSGLLQQTPNTKALLDEYISRFNMYVDQLKVEVRGAPKINMPYTK